MNPEENNQQPVNQPMPKPPSVPQPFEPVLQNQPLQNQAPQQPMASAQSTYVEPVKKPSSKTPLIAILVTLGLVLLSVGGWFGYKTLVSNEKVEKSQANTKTEETKEKDGENSDKMAATNAAGYKRVGNAKTGFVELDKQIADQCINSISDGIGCMNARLSYDSRGLAEYLTMGSAVEVYSTVVSEYDTFIKSAWGGTNTKKVRELKVDGYKATYFTYETTVGSQKFKAYDHYLVIDKSGTVVRILFKFYKDPQSDEAERIISSIKFK